MPHIYSTLSAPVKYTRYEMTENGTNMKTGEVLIKGGANVAPKNNEEVLATPVGIVTEVTDAELELLESNKVFELHKKNGHIIVVKGNEIKVSKAVEGMKDKDRSAPKTEADFSPNKIPTTGKGKSEK